MKCLFHDGPLAFVFDLFRASPEAQVALRCARWHHVESREGVRCLEIVTFPVRLSAWQAFSAEAWRRAATGRHAPAGHRQSAVFNDSGGDATEQAWLARG